MGLNKVADFGTVCYISDNSDAAFKDGAVKTNTTVKQNLKA